MYLMYSLANPSNSEFNMYRNEREAKLYGYRGERINHVPRRAHAGHGVVLCLGYAFSFVMAAAIGVMLAF